MNIEKEDIQKQIRAWKDKMAYWTKVNLVLCGICVVAPLVISHVLVEMRFFPVVLSYMASVAALVLVVVMPGARAAGYVYGLQHVQDALLRYKEEKIGIEELRARFAYEKATLEPPVPGQGGPRPPVVAAPPPPEAQAPPAEELPSGAGEGDAPAS